MLKDWELGVGRDLAGSQCKLRRERRIEVTKTVWPQKKTTPGNCEPGIDRDLVSDGEKLGTRPVIGPFGYPRTLSSIPARRKSFHECPMGMSSAVPLKPNETDLFCGLPVKCSLVFPRPSPSSCRNSHFLEEIFAFVCCCVRSNSGSSAFRCVSTRLQSGSLLFLGKICLDLTNSSNGRFSRAFRQCDRSSCSLVEGVSRS
jgi:hypothetical protein